MFINFPQRNFKLLIIKTVFAVKGTCKANVMLRFPQRKFKLLIINTIFAVKKMCKASVMLRFRQRGIAQLKDKSLADLENLPDPKVLALDTMENPESGLENFRSIIKQLG
jgi:hypothetical protein